ncbi:uncharacterized protein LOC122501132 [Leptopilina heterotoma]|uniref:uncharacterized protein LOC122501132 n=1 Tax=Leptopilina heterotoma TaxID=63436 RepID=UPI001CA86F7C|nr:uncharacterized protein LOC122501132 [Leptopilina heterotoma]
MGAKLEIPKGRGPFVFRIHGQVYHNTYDLHPNNSESRKYGQLYILDTNQAVLERLKHDSNKKFLPSLMKEIDELLRYINPYAKAFKMMREVELEEEIRAKLQNEPMRDIQMWIKRDRSLHQSKFNVPSCNEVAVVFVSEDGEPPVERDICIHPRNDKSIPIHNLSANADPMIYPLVFPAGDPGWTVNIKQKGGTDRDVTLLQFYIFRLSYRGKFNPCLQMGKLTQQLIVDFWSKVEGLRISYIYSNQKKLRAELYCGLMDYLYNKAAEENVRPGRIIVLPSTFTGGPRSYQQFFMDAMRLVQEFGKPDLFITMTCNPKWCEITENFLCGETASDRPDIVARVFQQKVKALMIELKDNQIFGPVIAYVYVIEFQKRGLPHVHLIVFLDQSHAIRDAETVDKIICAEIPDEAKHPELFNIVKQFQVHGPCGKQNTNSPCMNPETKVCTKHYPKPFTSETDYSKNYPEYRRRNDGRKIIFYNKDGSIKCTADNSMIVPYNPYLSKKFACHINVVACGSIGGVKYLFKYCYKGHDCAIVGIKDNNQVMNYDEPQHYLNTRYVCPPEAMHRLLEFNMHEQSHATYRLAVHLPDHQTICFTEGMEQQAIDTFKNTTLTAWFELNKKDPEAHKYLYSEIPHNYVFI